MISPFGTAFGQAFGQAFGSLPDSVPPQAQVAAGYAYAQNGIGYVGTLVLATGGSLAQVQADLSTLLAAAQTSDGAATGS